MKKSIFTLAALLIAHLASAEMLYWMIGDSTNGGSNTIEFNYAVMYAVNGESKIKIALPNNGEGGEIYGNENLSPITTTNPQMTEFGEDFDWSNCSFYVELMAWDGVKESSVGVSEFATYDSLVSKGHIIPSGMGIPETAHIWMPTTAVPEPTSGLLILIGLASLALKRKNAIR